PVGAGVAALDTVPVVARGDVRVMRLAADGGGIEQQFGAHQRHAAGSFREPLVPADGYTDLRIAGVPDLEAAVAGVEVVLLVVAGAVRDVTLAVDAQQRAVGIDDGDGVEAGAPGQLEEADRQHHGQLLGDLLEMQDRRVFLYRGGQLQIFGVGLLAEVGRLEQFLDQDHLGTFAGGFADKLFGLGDVRLAIPGARHLSGGDGNGTG